MTMNISVFVSNAHRAAKPKNSAKVGLVWVIHRAVGGQALKPLYSEATALCPSASKIRASILRGDGCDMGQRMLGLHISFYRQTNEGTAPATFESPKGTRVAVWQAGIGGLDWLVQSEKAGKAIFLRGNGYPGRYTAIAEHLMPEIIDVTRVSPGNWLLGEHDIVRKSGKARTWLTATRWLPAVQTSGYSSRAGT
jgi:hypothetical protein